MNNNQTAYSLNFQDIQRKNSEIPTNVIGKSNNRAQDNQNSDEEDNQNRINQEAQQNWKVDVSRLTNSMFDYHHLTQKQISQYVSISNPWNLGILIVLAILTSGLKAISFLFIDLQDQDDQSLQGGYILRAFWRQLLISLSLIPFVYLEYNKEKSEVYEDRFYQKKYIFDKDCLKIIMLCSIFSAVWVGTLAYSIFHAPVANVYIFNNIYPLFFVFFKQFSSISENIQIKMSSNKYEKCGAFIVILVLILLNFVDSQGFHAGLISLIGAFSASMYYNSFLKIQYKYPYMFAILLISCGMSFLFGLYSLIFENSTFDRNISHGLFGVFSFKWIFIHIIICLLIGVANTKLYTQIKAQIKTVYVDFVVMSEVIGVLFLALIFQFQDIPNITQCSLYLFYFVGMALIAIGKSEAEIEQISLHDDNNLNENLMNTNQYPDSKINVMNKKQNFKDSYIPNSQFSSPKNKQQQQTLIVPKKHTIGYVYDPSLIDFSKLASYQNNSIIEGKNESPKVINLSFNQNQTPNSKSQINTIIEQQNELFDSQYTDQSSNEKNFKENNIKNNHSHTLNDQISEFSRQFHPKNKINI